MNAVFTEAMKQTHTILLPQMLEYHFPILQAALTVGGYKTKVLSVSGREAREWGKKYVHNDMCFPAVNIIGQMIAVLKNGEYDADSVAFLIPQAGGSCRATGYYYILQKALAAAGYEQVPIISLNLSGVNNQPGFSITLSMIVAAVAAVCAGDLLMHLYQQVRPYEKEFGKCDELLAKWQQWFCNQIAVGKLKNRAVLRKAYKEVIKDFSAVPRQAIPKTKVGIVGELYIKYCSLGNFNAEQFLLEHGCEIRTTGFAVYALYVLQGDTVDDKSSTASKFLTGLLLKYLQKVYGDVCEAVASSGCFAVMPQYSDFAKWANCFISDKCVTGDGWLISAEAAVLIEQGYDRVIAFNPFGCLVSHINSKGVAAGLRRYYPQAKITNIDCDADGSEILLQSRMLMGIGSKLKN